MTKAGIKTEDYRKITPYWCNILCLANGKKDTRKEWELFFKHFNVFENPKQILNPYLYITFVDFKTNKITKGYPKKNDTKRIITLEHKGIEVGYGKPEWGAEPDKLYFIIKHGKIINIKKNNERNYQRI